MCRCGREERSGPARMAISDHTVTLSAAQRTLGVLAEDRSKCLWNCTMSRPRRDTCCSEAKT